MDLFDKFQKILERESTVKRIVSTLNNFIDLKDTLESILGNLRDLTNVEAISLRLKDEGDYPYLVFSGFPIAFIRHANSICIKESASSPDNNNGSYECFCGAVISNNKHIFPEFFTPKGTFWTNNLSVFLTKNSDKLSKWHLRNYCHECGYQSIALVPIKISDVIIGLIQMNDPRIGMFTTDLIEYLEMIGEHIGMAIQNRMIYSRMKDSYDRIISLEGVYNICVNCKRIKDDKGEWKDIEIFLRRYTDIEFSQSLCPKCKERIYEGVERIEN